MRHIVIDVSLMYLCTFLLQFDALEDLTDERLTAMLWCIFQSSCVSPPRVWRMGEISGCLKFWAVSWEILPMPEALEILRNGEDGIDLFTDTWNWWCAESDNSFFDTYRRHLHLWGGEVTPGFSHPLRWQRPRNALQPGSLLDISPGDL